GSGGNGSGSSSGSGAGGGSGGGFVCSGRVVPAKGARKIASDGDFVYWTTWGDPNTQKNGSIWRAPVKGGPPEKLAADEEATTDIAVDRDHVYFVAYGAHVGRVPKTG